jgi:hypothetical protein
MPLRFVVIAAGEEFMVIEGGDRAGQRQIIDVERLAHAVQQVDHLQHDR